MPTYNESVSDSIGTSDAVAGLFPETVSDAPVASETCIVEFRDSVSDSALAEDSVDVAQADSERDIGALTDAASAQVNFANAVSDSQEIVDCAIVEVSSACAAPFEATLSARETIVLTHPYVGPTLTLELRNPNFGNVERLTQGSVEHVSALGNPRFVSDPDWPQEETHVFSFEGLSAQKADDLLTFLETSAGTEIGLLDHEGRQWRGVIVTPSNQVLREGRDCQWSASFEFMGDLA